MPQNADGSNGSSNFDPAIQTEKLAFDAAELIKCGCGRNNPPNRLQCMYCGTALGIEVDGTAAIKSYLRKLEDWERGYNIIILNGTDIANVSVASVAGLVSLDADEASLVIEAGSPLPIARVESTEEVAVIQKGLEVMGFKTMVVADTDLDADKYPVRLGGAELNGSGLTVRAFNTGEKFDLGGDDNILVVTGVLATSKIDSSEKKGRRGRESKVLNETATATDELVLDIYAGSFPSGFRVHQAGFDYSCLGKDTGLLAGENLQRLMKRIIEQVPRAVLIDSYQKVRQALGYVWDLESRKDAKGLQGSGFARFEYGTVSSTNNLKQFTKYSRLQRHINEGKKV